MKTTISLLLLFLVTTTLTAAEQLVSTQCEPLTENTSVDKVVPYAKGLLWQLRKDGATAGYVFGTMHIADKEVVMLAPEVEEALTASRQFAMEAIPNQKVLLELSQSMILADGKQLGDFVDEAIYKATEEILADYNMAAAGVAKLKPWAAFLTMNYPPNPSQSQPLDFVLLAKARENRAVVLGLEKVTEQLAIFDQLTFEQQAKLLTDAVCHYDFVRANFARTKEFYLQQDLAGLYRHGQRYTMTQQPRYKALYDNVMGQLIERRNEKMVARLKPILAKGKTFIAIGALHLPGKDGVLALLAEQGYTIEAVF